jgi:acyl-coenzyme A thioesterase PaaI-like protein
MPDIGPLVDAVRRKYDDECFACGRDNPHGMHLDGFELDANGTVSARFQPRPEYRGTLGVLHGGIAATALDEVMVWAGILNLGVMSVTGTLDLRYSGTAEVRDHFTASAWIEEQRGRRLLVAGALTAQGTAKPSVTASGLYLISADVSDLLADDT